MYSILLNIATKLELQKATHGAKLELLEATLVTLESYKRRCTVETQHTIQILHHLYFILIIALHQPSSFVIIRIVITISISISISINTNLMSIHIHH